MNLLEALVVLMEATVEKADDREVGKARRRIERKIEGLQKLRAKMRKTKEGKTI